MARVILVNPSAPPGSLASVRKRIAGLKAAIKRHDLDHGRSAFKKIGPSLWGPRRPPHHYGPTGKYAGLKGALNRAQRLEAEWTKRGQMGLFSKRRNPSVNLERGPRFLHQPKPGSAESLQRRIYGLESAIARRKRTGRSSAGLQTAAARARAAAKKKPALSYFEAPRRNPRKRKNSMAKRSAAQKAAFSRMRAGLARYKAKRRKTRTNGRRKKAAARRRTTTTKAVALINPTTRRKHTMARRRRKRNNPRHHAHHTRRRRNPARRHHRRRHNPGLGGPVKSVISALVPAAAGGLAAGFLDAKVTGGLSMPLRIGAKLLGAALGGLLLKRRPMQAAAFMGSMIGSAGYEGGVRLGGGVIATSKGAGMKELAAMAAEDEESLGLLTEELAGMGLLTEMGDDGDDMSEIEPDLGDIEPDLGDGEEEFGDDDD